MCRSTDRVELGLNTDNLAVQPLGTIWLPKLWPLQPENPIVDASPINGLSNHTPTYSRKVNWYTCSGRSCGCVCCICCAFLFRLGTSGILLQGVQELEFW